MEETALLKLQASIDVSVVNALIAATPETWNAAEMSVEREDVEGRESMMIHISSPEGLRDIVGPTDEIYMGLYQLSDLYREHRPCMWSRVSYSARLMPDGPWTYTVKFQY